MNLTDEQQAVVDLTAGLYLVLAPPGSGKTEMLSQRIFRAVRAGVAPERMLCATFTNRAAFEMRDRVRAEVGELALGSFGGSPAIAWRDRDRGDRRYVRTESGISSREGRKLLRCLH